MRFNLLKSRRNKLKEKIKLELDKETPNIEEILNFVDGYEKDNLDTIVKLRKDKIYNTKRISGAIKSTIDAHGPITDKLIGSATKRIYGTLLDSTIKKPKYSSSKIIRIVFEVIITITLAILAFK